MNADDGMLQESSAPSLERNSGAVSLHIERLVIDGLPLAAGEISQLQTAMQRELTHLLQRDGVGPAGQGGAVCAAHAPEIHMSTPFRSADFGRQIARSLHESLSKPQ